jgi:hypothetical protein
MMGCKICIWSLNTICQSEAAKQATQVASAVSCFFTWPLPITKTESKKMTAM